MGADLTDVEAARLVRKHPRTIQRWCTKGRLRGAYKAGRSWRIPADALVKAGLGAALEPDTLESKLAVAHAAVQELLAELDDAARQKQRPVVHREWDAVAARARTLASSSARLADVASGAH